MESLIYGLFWAGIVFLLLRFGQGAHAIGNGHGQHGTPAEGSERNPKQLGWTAPKTALDPVCGKTVQTSAAKSSINDGAVHYSCSRECRERFEVGPNFYLGQTPKAPAEAMSHDHG